MAHHDLLVGLWTGEGAGEYPTINPFAYRETLLIEAVPGRPLATWKSTTVDAVSGEARHSEVGFLRSDPTGCELVLAHGFGIGEVARSEPPLDGVFRFESWSISSSPSAKDVARIVRVVEVSDDGLRYSTAMAAVGVDLTHHLAADLHR